MKMKWKATDVKELSVNIQQILKNEYFSTGWIPQINFVVFAAGNSQKFAALFDQVATKHRFCKTIIWKT